MEKHGKKEYIDFNDIQRKKMRKYFQDLDEDGGGTFFNKNFLLNFTKGSIGVEELEEPLIALGLVQSRKEVEALMKNVDDDGEIVFDEFLNLVSSSKGGKSSNLI